MTVTESAAETEALGARLAELLGPGDVVVVSGEVGAGKTTLIRGACRALGIESPVTIISIAARMPRNHAWKCMSGTPNRTAG